MEGSLKIISLGSGALFWTFHHQRGNVNDGISKPPFTVQYVSVDAFIDGIMSLGRGTLMAKFDVASTYRNVAIHPDDCPLLSMQWLDNIL